MTTCLVLTSPSQLARDRASHPAVRAAPRKPAQRTQSPALLRLLTGADGVKLPHHPRRPRLRRT